MIAKHRTLNARFCGRPPSAHSSGGLSFESSEMRRDEKTAMAHRRRSSPSFPMVPSAYNAETAAVDKAAPNAAGTRYCFGDIDFW